MKRSGSHWMLLAAVAIATLLGTVVNLHADTVMLGASQDNTLYQVSDQFSVRSNGAGPQLFAGKTGQGSIRRGLLAFDVAGNIPAGATIDDVRLELKLSRFPFSTSQTFSLHRLDADWGQGASNAGTQGAGAGTQPEVGDATWFHTFWNTDTWTNPGGDFEPTPSASQTVDNIIATYTWTSDGLIDDVQDWLDNGSNFGWLLRGNESATKTAKQFESSESLTAADRPKLIVDFSLPVISSDLTGDGTVDFADLTILLAHWNSAVGQPELGNLVLHETTAVDFADLTALLADWGPAAAASPEVALAVAAVPEPSTFALTLVAALTELLFRRK